MDLIITFGRTFNLLYTFGLINIWPRRHHAGGPAVILALRQSMSNNLNLDIVTGHWRCTRAITNGYCLWGAISERKSQLYLECSSIFVDRSNNKMHLLLIYFLRHLGSCRHIWSHRELQSNYPMRVHHYKFDNQNRLVGRLTPYAIEVMFSSVIFNLKRGSDVNLRLRLTCTQTLL